MKKVFLLGFFAILFVAACKHYPDNVKPIGGGNNGGNNGGGNNSNNCNPDTVYFVKDIQPLLSANCAVSGCHDAGTQQDGVNLSSYSGIMNSGVIVPGNANASDLYEAIHETDPDKVMPPPPGNPLTQSQKDLIRKWIEQGALNNNCDQGACDTIDVKFATEILPIMNKYCTTCHSGNGASGNVRLSTYNEVRTEALNGKLFGTVAWLDGYNKMPFGATNKIPDCDIKKIKAWVDAGALNN